MKQFNILSLRIASVIAKLTQLGLTQLLLFHQLCQGPSSTTVLAIQKIKSRSRPQHYINFGHPNLSLIPGPNRNGNANFPRAISFSNSYSARPQQNQSPVPTVGGPNYLGTTAAVPVYLKQFPTTNLITQQTPTQSLRPNQQQMASPSLLSRSQSMELITTQISELDACRKTLYDDLVDLPGAMNFDTMNTKFSREDPFAQDSPYTPLRSQDDDDSTTTWVIRIPLKSLQSKLQQQAPKTQRFYSKPNSNLNSQTQIRSLLILHGNDGTAKQLYRLLTDPQSNGLEEVLQGLNLCLQSKQYQNLDSLEEIILLEYNAYLNLQSVPRRPGPSRSLRFANSPLGSFRVQQMPITPASSRFNQTNSNPYSDFAESSLVANLDNALRHLTTPNSNPSQLQSQQPTYNMNEIALIAYSLSGSVVTAWLEQKLSNYQKLHTPNNDFFPGKIILISSPASMYDAVVEHTIKKGEVQSLSGVCNGVPQQNLVKSSTIERMKKVMRMVKELNGNTGVSKVEGQSSSFDSQSTNDSESNNVTIKNNYLNRPVNLDFHLIFGDSENPTYFAKWQQWRDEYNSIATYGNLNPSGPYYQNQGTQFNFLQPLPKASHFQSPLLTTRNVNKPHLPISMNSGSDSESEVPKPPPFHIISPNQGHILMCKNRFISADFASNKIYGISVWNGIRNMRTYGLDLRKVFEAVGGIIAAPSRGKMIVSI